MPANCRENGSLIAIRATFSHLTECIAHRFADMRPEFNPRPHRQNRKAEKRRKRGRIQSAAPGTCFLLDGPRKNLGRLMPKTARLQAKPTHFQRSAQIPEGQGCLRRERMTDRRLFCFLLSSDTEIGELHQCPFETNMAHPSTQCAYIKQYIQAFESIRAAGDSFRPPSETTNATYHQKIRNGR